MQSVQDNKAVRTKYDRMFERKNQGVLAPHFSALVQHDDMPQNEDDDFLTLKARDHTLEDVGLGGTEGPDGSITAPVVISAELSKRKLKMGESKKAMLKNKTSGHKVIFDEEGEAHELYEMEPEEEFTKRGNAQESRDEYLRVNREVMKEADLEDRRVAREKRQEKKRKRKEREREEVSCRFI
jgi:ATP-dependent RNA helicase DDX10/DBP4